MHTAFSVVLGSCLIAVAAYTVGLSDGKHTTATACEKTGSFYVRDKVFKCEVKK